MDRHTGGLRERDAESHPCGTLSYFCGLFLLGFLWPVIFLPFYLVNHFDLSGSQSIFSVSQDPPMCVHPSLSQYGFYLKGAWIE